MKKKLQVRLRKSYSDPKKLIGTDHWVTIAFSDDDQPLPATSSDYPEDIWEYRTLSEPA